MGAGYRGFRTRHESEHGKPRRELSGSCNIDVVCPEGNGWEAEIASVAVYSKGGSLACTGAMINDAESSGAPHFLTANHCGVSSSNAASVVAYWNYQSSSCVPGSTSGDGPLTQFSSGATHLVSNSQSDVTLIRLNDLPNPEYGVTYAGWDRSGNAATIAVAIHHPSCDEKRISFMYDTTAISGFFRSGDTHVRVADWDKGTTEPGSSGSPLFDQNHRIIGQLHGGSAACGNNLEDYYGRFFKSWTAGLAQYLDPVSIIILFIVRSYLMQLQKNLTLYIILFYIPNITDQHRQNHCGYTWCSNYNSHDVTKTDPSTDKFVGLSRRPIKR